MGMGFVIEGGAPRFGLREYPMGNDAKLPVTARRYIFVSMGVAGLAFRMRNASMSLTIRTLNALRTTLFPGHVDVVVWRALVKATLCQDFPHNVPRNNLGTAC